MNHLNGKTAILYRRVSTTEQKLHGNSLTAQKSSLREFCSNNNIEIKKEFQEDYSAKNFNRPEWNRLNEYAKKNKGKIDYLLVYDWDRFSRNAFEALGVIENFKKLDIEVNCINKWVNNSDPTQIIMQLMYLGMPEVDNKIRSQKVRMGMNQARKEGRWVSKQPIGYVKGRDEFDKPLMKPDPQKAPLVTELFELFATGIYSQNELIKMNKFRKLNLSKSNLSRMLRNVLYVGKIDISDLEDVQEQVIDAQHEPIVGEETFNTVQIQLGKRNRFKGKIKKHDEVLYLRGHLKCKKCGSNLTGSRSKSKTGNYYYYYHCNPKKGCNERFKIEDAHNELKLLFDSLKPPKEIGDLFELILEDHYKTLKTTKISQIKRLEEEIKGLKGRLQTLLDKLLEGVISNENYKDYNSKIEAQILEKKNLLIELNDYQEDLQDYISFGLNLLNNLDEFFTKSDSRIKGKLLSSIFDEKMEFDGEKYRTPKFNEAIELIYSNIKGLESLETKKGDDLSKVSHLVLEAGLEPARP